MKLPRVASAKNSCRVVPPGTARCDYIRDAILLLYFVLNSVRSVLVKYRLMFLNHTSERTFTLTVVKADTLSLSPCHCSSAINLCDYQGLFLFHWERVAEIAESNEIAESLLSRLRKISN